MPSKTWNSATKGKAKATSATTCVEHVRPRGAARCRCSFFIRENNIHVEPYLVTQGMEMASMMDVLEANFAHWGLQSPRRLPILFQYFSDGRGKG